MNEPAPQSSRDRWHRRGFEETWGRGLRDPPAGLWIRLSRARTGGKNRVWPRRSSTQCLPSCRRAPTVMRWSWPKGDVHETGARRVPEGHRRDSAGTGARRGKMGGGQGCGGDRWSSPCAPGASCSARYPREQRAPRSHRDVQRRADARSLDCSRCHGSLCRGRHRRPLSAHMSLGRAISSKERGRRFSHAGSSAAPPAILCNPCRARSGSARVQ
jgi:hypothetical protein